MTGDLFLGAIAALESERAELAGQLEKVDLTLEFLRGRAFKKAPKPVARRVVKKKPKVKARRVVEHETPRTVSAPNDTVTSIIERELDAGPKSTSELATAAKTRVDVIRDAVEMMAAAGRVHRIGSGPRNYQWKAGKAA